MNRAMQPSLGLAAPPLIVLSYLFRFVSYKRGFELSLSSREISAADAEGYGIVTSVVPPGAALAEALRVADFAIQPHAPAPQTATLFIGCRVIQIQDRCDDVSQMDPCKRSPPRARFRFRNLQ